MIETDTEVLAARAKKVVGALLPEEKMPWPKEFNDTLRKIVEGLWQDGYMAAILDATDTNNEAPSNEATLLSRVQDFYR